MRMTVFKRNWHVTGDSRPLSAIAQAIRTHPGLATWTARVASESNKKRRDKLKQNLLPAVTIAGEFAYRSNTGVPPPKSKAAQRPRRQAEPYILNGLYAFDLDALDHDPLMPRIAQADLLRSDLAPHIALIYTSPSGSGLRVAIHGPPAEDTKAYSEMWDAMNAYVEQIMVWEQYYGMASDKQSRVACMPYLLAHDLTCYANPQAEPVTPPPLPKKERPWRPPPQHRHYSGTGRSKLATAEDVHRALGDRSYGPNGSGWYATTDEICHGGSSDKALGYRTDDDGLFWTKCFGSANCDSRTIRHELQTVTGLILCICPDCRKERSSQ